MKLQRQLSNGEWMRIEETRVEEFLGMCEQENGWSDDKIVPIFRATRPLTRDEVLAALAAGRKLRSGGQDWYDNCRCAEGCEARLAARRATAPPVKLVKCSCGHTIPSGSVMSASLGSSCPNCYDRLSM